MQGRAPQGSRRTRTLTLYYFQPDGGPARCTCGCTLPGNRQHYTDDECRCLVPCTCAASTYAGDVYLGHHITPGAGTDMVNVVFPATTDPEAARRVHRELREHR